MTELLEKALAEVSKLSPEEQDAIAAIILETLGDEQRWETAFAASQDKLAKLAKKAREDVRAGRVRKIPVTDSIEELARFWNTHSLTDFEGELEEVTEPVFRRDNTKGKK